MEYDVEMEDYLKIDVKFFEDLFLMGDDVQKISIIHSLPQLIAFDSAATYTRIIPKIKQDLPNSSCEYQMAASGVFKTLLLRSGNTSILQSIIQGVDSKDANVAFAWAEALFACITTMPEGLIQSNLLPLAKQKFQPNSSVSAKLFCCRLIGEICAYSRFRLIDVKKDILPLATGLCQDVVPEVRAQICTYIPKVAQALGREVEKTNLLSCIVELAHDDNVTVRSSSIIAMSPMLRIVSQDISKNTLLPLIKKLCTKGVEESVLTALILSNEFGPLMQGCQNLLTEQDVSFFVKVYKQLSLKGKQTTTSKSNATKEVTIRQRCASNTYGIMKLVFTSQPGQMQEVYAVFREHVIDPCYLVRRAAAGVLADIAQLLDKENKIMKNEIVRLLRDDAVEVLDVIVPLVASIFASLVNSGTLNYNESTQATTELCKALIKCQTELSKGYNWRLTIEYLKQLEILPQCVSSDYIHNNFTPLLFEKLVNGKAKPVRQQAIRTIVVFMRYNFKPNQNKWIKESLIRQTALSKCCYNRAMYFYVCESILSVYSEKFFKEGFLPNCLSLATDKVISVRWKFMHFSTKLKSMVTLASDGASKQLILDTISKLEAAEKSKSVLDIIKARKREGTPKYSADALREEERRVREECTTNIKSSSPLSMQRTPALAATGDAKHVSIVRQHDMRFLEHHFYIDAGIKLDTIDFETDETALECTPTVVSDISNLDPSDLTQIETTNITDDVKVNLRNIKSKLIPPISYRSNSEHNNKIKRHSSILSANCLEKMTIKDPSVVNKRRSLNLCHFTESKIPIPNRSKFILSANHGNGTKDDNTTDEPKRRTSNLPVYNRSTPPPAKAQPAAAVKPTPRAPPTSAVSANRLTAPPAKKVR